MRKSWKNLRALYDSNDLVAEIVGTVLLLGVTVAVFSTMYFTVASHPEPQESTLVNLVATVEGNNIIIEHRGGEALNLDAKMFITIGDETEEIVVGEEDYLEDEAKKDNQWNVGERIVYQFNYSLSYREAEITVVDKTSNSIVMSGILDITPESDVGIKVSVDNESPNIGTDVVFTITVTNYRGDLDATGIVVQYILPNGLIYKDNKTTQGTYYKVTGNWDVGELRVRESATLSITAEVKGGPTQLAIILDGSRSISNDSWYIMKKGLVNAIKNPNIFPHDGGIELTIIQYGVDEYCAKLELGPIVVKKNNYKYIVNRISKIKQGNGTTPMAAGIYLAADTLESSNNFGGFDPDNRQIINLVTDGNPNVKSDPGELCGRKLDGETEGKKAAENAISYLISSLKFSKQQDEIDAVAVFGDPAPDVNWLKNKVAWPQPGSTEWPPKSSGWVHYVQSWQEFSDSIDEQFGILFSGITSDIKITFTTLRDPNMENNQVSITIKPG